MGEPINTGELGNTGAGEGQPIVDSNSGQNPAWAPFLQQIPSQFHESVTPVLKQWDQNYNKGINDVKAQYAPYQFLVDGQIPGEHVQIALNMIKALEADPRSTLETISNYYGITPQQAQQLQQQQQQNQQQQQQQQFADDDPRYSELKSMYDKQQEHLQLLTQAAVAKHQEEIQRQQDAQLEVEMTNLHKKYATEKGYDFNEKVVMGMSMGGNLSPEQAVQAYYSEMDKIFSQMKMSAPIPNIMGSGGGLPSGKVNTRNMGQNDLDKFVAQYLQEGTRNGQ